MDSANMPVNTSKPFQYEEVFFGDRFFKHHYAMKNPLDLTILASSVYFRFFSTLRNEVSRHYFWDCLPSIWNANAISRATVLYMLTPTQEARILLDQLSTSITHALSRIRRGFYDFSKIFSTKWVYNLNKTHTNVSENASHNRLPK